MKIESMKVVSFSCALAGVTVIGMALLASCGGKKAPIPPPPTNNSGSNTAPSDNSSGQRPVVVSFTAEPSSIERGQTAVLRWSVSNATDVAIDHGIGTVQNTGTSPLRPSDTTTYTLTASGAGGTTTATATITLTAPAPPPPPTSITRNPIGTFTSRVESDLQDVLFDYDSNNIRDDARNALSADADALKKIFADFPAATINVEGHCDERGSAEYNLGLGDRRATSARDYLVQLGVPAAKLKTISYGKERPTCTESDESCWQRNRRAHFSAGQ
jgi:peptidoglycan-associated lipoprotein